MPREQNGNDMTNSSGHSSSRINITQEPKEAGFVFVLGGLESEWLQDSHGCDCSVRLGVSTAVLGEEWQSDQSCPQASRAPDKMQDPGLFQAC